MRIVLSEEHGLVASDRECEVPVFECPCRNACNVKSHLVVPMAREALSPPLFPPAIDVGSRGLLPERPFGPHYGWKCARKRDLWRMAKLNLERTELQPSIRTGCQVHGPNRHLGSQAEPVCCRSAARDYGLSPHLGESPKRLADIRRTRAKRRFDRQHVDTLANPPKPPGFGKTR